MTSNLGSELILEARDMAEVRSGIDALLRGSFKPEFINRIDETVVFERLGREQILAIVDIQMRLLAQRLASRGITMEWGRELAEFLVEKGYDPHFGARPLKRAIQSLVQNPLSREVLAGRIPEGSSVRVTLSEGIVGFLASAK
jgi:ATP-dependent Clp protease ATP-binding subunit ClpB